MENLKKEIIDNLMKGDDIDSPHLIIGYNSFSKRQIADEIEKNSEFGSRFVNNIILLALDLFMRGKEKLNG